MLPVLKVAISGLSSGSTAALSSSVMPLPPPVVGCTITSHRSLMPDTTSRKTRDGTVCPSRLAHVDVHYGRARLWAPTAESTISSGVMGIAGLCPGTVMPPVIAALIMTFSTSCPFRRVPLRPMLKTGPSAANRPGPDLRRVYTLARTSPSKGVAGDRRENRRGSRLLSTVLEGSEELPARSVPQEVLDDVLEVARWSGSASNRQPWELVVIRDRETLGTLSRLDGYAPT